MKLFLRPERERHRREDAHKRRHVVPADFLVQHNHRETAEDRQRDDLLHDLELRDGIDRKADAVGWNHEQIFKERDAPAREDDQPERQVFEFRIQIAVPRDGHENVRASQQHHGQPAGLSKIHRAKMNSSAKGVKCEPANSQARIALPSFIHHRLSSHHALRRHRRPDL